MNKTEINTRKVYIPPVLQVECLPETDMITTSGAVLESKAKYRTAVTFNGASDWD